MRLSARPSRPAAPALRCLILVPVLLAAAACNHAPAAPATTATAAPVVVATVAAEELEVVVTAVPERGTPAPTYTPVPLGATYTDPAAGYSIDYPAGWFLYPNPGGGAILTSYDVDKEAGRGGVPADEAKLDIVLDPAGHPETPAQTAERVRAEVEVLFEFEAELVSGYPMVRLQVRSEIGGTMAILLTAIDGTSFQLQGFGDLSRFDAIAGTLRPAGASAAATGADACIVAPLAAGCPRPEPPAGLAADVDFAGVLPEDGVEALAWSPDGRHLAYAVSSPELSSQGLVVRRLPDLALVDRWSMPGISSLSWTPDGTGVAFLFDPGSYIAGIGLARLGRADLIDLLPDGAAEMSVEDGKSFAGWLSDTELAFRLYCGAGCQSLYGLDVTTGALHRLVNTDSEDGPHTTMPGTDYLLSPDGAFLAVTDRSAGPPRAFVLPWPGPGEPLRPGIAEVQFGRVASWAGGELALIAYPPGDPEEWSPLPDTTLYVWDVAGGSVRPVIEGAFSAAFSPDGGLIAALVAGEPVVGDDGMVRAAAEEPYPSPWVALVAWPEGGLVAAQRLSERQHVIDDYVASTFPAPVWSADGGRALVWPEDGVVSILERDGRLRLVAEVGQAGSVPAALGDGHLALVIDRRVVIVRP